MKKLVQLVIYCSFFTNVIAADLYVREFGAGGAYPTISTAIAAANDGDRIIIEPKAGDIPYVENITIDKSLTLVSEVLGHPYYILGDIEIIPDAGRKVTISNASMASNDILMNTNHPGGARTEVKIVKCTVDFIDFNISNVSTEVISCEAYQIQIVHGKIIASDIGKNLFIQSESNSATIANDPIYIIANAIQGEAGVHSLWLESNHYDYKIYNNRIWSYADAISIRGSKPNGFHSIYNNYLSNTSTVSTRPLIFFSNDSPLMCITDIRNNQLHLNSTTAPYIEGGGGASIFAYFNMSNQTNFDSRTTGVTALASNSHYSNVDDLIDAGHPAPEFIDLDLTTNDVGIDGGSHSWENYRPSNANNKPQIYFLDMLHRITTGNTIDVKASGFSK